MKNNEGKVKGKEDMSEGHYQIRIHDIFESAHFLYNYYPDGSDEEMHGHTWEAEVFAETSRLENGISVDFLELRKKFSTIVQGLDHILINEHPDFKGINPTAENIARFIYSALEDSYPEHAVISEVRVWEGPKNYASYFPQPDNHKTKKISRSS